SGSRTKRENTSNFLGVARVLAVPTNEEANFPLSEKAERELVDDLGVTIKRDWNLRRDILDNYHDSHFFANFITKRQAYNINFLFPFRILALLSLASSGEYPGGVLALDSEYHLLQPWKLLQLITLTASQQNFLALFPGPPLHFSFVVASFISWDVVSALKESWRKIVARVFDAISGQELFPPRYLLEFLPAKMLESVYLQVQQGGPPPHGSAGHQSRNKLEGGRKQAKASEVALLNRIRNIT
ncbi:unnamed protein product, partial [Amoebophrya sp. A25]